MNPLRYRRLLGIFARAAIIIALCCGAAVAERPAEMRSAGFDEEEKIVAQLAALLTDKDTALHNYAAERLGRLGRVEFVPQLFANMDCEPHLFSDFYFAHRLNYGEPPPEDMLRAGLRFSLPMARSCIVNVIAAYKMTSMRKEVEKLLENDPSEWVRSSAGAALRQIGDSASASVILRAVQKDPTNAPSLEALEVVGRDANVPALLVLLEKSTGRTRTRILRTLAEMPVTKPQPLSDAFLHVLEQEPNRPSLDAAVGLARFHDRRALPFLRRIVKTQAPDFREDHRCTRAIADAGGPEAVALLNEMVANGWRGRGNLEGAMAKLGDPSSARAVWPIYRENPMRRVISGWCATTGGYHQALPVLRACADQDLLKEIRGHAAVATQSPEKYRFDRLIVAIEQRLSGIPAGAPF